MARFRRIICTTLPEELVDQLDKKRGDVSRSVAVQRILEKALAVK